MKLCIKPTKLLLALTAPVILCTHIAVAQPAAASVAQHPSNYCNASTLSDIQFMQIIYKIMAHGDVTDVAFIEKTLGTKFVMTTYPPRLQTDQMLGSPIPVSLYLHWTEAYPPKKGWVSKIYFQTRGIDPADRNFLKDCLHIPVSNFFSAYKGQFFSQIPVGLIGPFPVDQIDVTATQEHGMPGENGSQLQLNLEYVAPINDVFAKNSIIYGVAIVQQP